MKHSNKSQHKVSKRKCPQCQEVKEFPERNETCGANCASSLVRERAAAVPPKEQVKHEVKGDSWAISADATRICTLDELVAHCKIDLQVWEVERFVANKWEVGAKSKSLDKIVAAPLFQIKAWLKRKANISNALREIESLKKAAEKYSPRIPKVIRPSAQCGNIAEVGCPDIHIGKLAWGVETGYGNWDVDTALKVYETAMDTITNRVSRYDLDELVYVIGNDLFHTDGRENMTTAGTHVDTDSRYHKTFERVRELHCKKIDEYRQIAKVRLVIVPGNHDEQTTWHLGDSLKCWFRTATDVVIDNTPSPRKYYQHGKVMIMWCHGHKGKRDDYPMQMATERSEMFGATRFREIHTGHLHKLRVDEKYGVRTRILPSLCEPDYWHSVNGFTGNIKAAQGFIWNKDEGLIGTAEYCLIDRVKAA